MEKEEKNQKSKMQRASKFFAGAVLAGMAIVGGVGAGMVVDKIDNKKAVKVEEAVKNDWQTEVANLAEDILKSAKREEFVELFGNPINLNKTAEKEAFIVSYIKHSNRVASKTFAGAMLLLSTALMLYAMTIRNTRTFLSVDEEMDRVRGFSPSNIKRFLDVDVERDRRHEAEKLKTAEYFRKTADEREK